MRISDWSSDVCSSDLACDKDSSTASWGLRPRRLAAFGRPGSLKRSSHPASPIRGSRLRRHTFVCLEMIAIVALLSPAHRLNQPVQMAYKKHKEVRRSGAREGRERGKVTRGASTGQPSYI